MTTVTSSGAQSTTTTTQETLWLREEVRQIQGASVEALAQIVAISRLLHCYMESHNDDRDGDIQTAIRAIETIATEAGQFAMDRDSYHTAQQCIASAANGSNDKIGA
ncbi:hypothetical protein [Candidatus Symbiobacter mobilis]|uniref:Uncharacterized protein n=1 Tax=Candidatus Symbiobacter mobilis CR TaxID=946483 RepID=U5NBU9_9BURK|nr:hypothetical protein [Candidatus Symbiobacter mobilis]AGX87659.1 hypothetical protein Cenrod_1574 [Candidatus Symbiobacter mobilis CR]